MVRKASTDLTADDTPRVTKRHRTEDSTSTTEGILRDGLLADSARQTYRETFAASKPYLHCVMNELCNDNLLRKVRAEIMSALHFTVKETDIYKVHQTGDLANMDGLPAEELSQLSSLFKLRNALYSAEFRSFLADITGCGPLSGSKTDMSINTYLNGCHLLNHDDVIGSRRVSYILYLPDPDEPWPAHYGGALELYPVVTKGTPAVSPTVSIPPQWNQFVMFTVQPGHSFHSVEEVVVDKARLSISGWFHIPQEGEPGYTPEREEGEATASLDQLQEGITAPFLPYSEEEDADMSKALEGLSEDDISTLSRWLNPMYLNIKLLQQVSDKFLEESSIQLVDFLKKDLVEKIKTAVIKEDKDCGLDEPEIPPHGVGEHGSWMVAGPPHKLRYAMLDPTDAAAPRTDDTESAKLFAELAKDLFPSPAFRRWLALITQLVPRSRRGIARRFRPGLDYTLAWSSPDRLLDATLCFGTRINEEADDDAWNSDEVGGYEAYMAPHDGEEDAAVYKQMDDDGALLTVSAGWNVLTLVLRDEGLMRFIKYVSASAPGSRWDVAYEYEIPAAEDEDDDDDE
ncbi:hypothetical protein PhCBS80983_g01448 [Powellomyces hirtus]|uniref:uS12 prolyl 3,4-dihydroxylase n=1 Tax=Powellomyces hirtus TaxID=109895 RepID=A0A507ECU5_9FUNG|nr:hypothetical protein PhCBS80983_g01448 [Powellomyces hirtus]